MSVPREAFIFGGIGIGSIITIGIVFKACQRGVFHGRSKKKLPTNSSIPPNAGNNPSIPVIPQPILSPENPVTMWLPVQIPHQQPNHHQQEQPHQNDVHNSSTTVMYASHPPYVYHIPVQSSPVDDNDSQTSSSIETFPVNELLSFEARGDDRNSQCPICLAPLGEEPVSTGNCLHLVHTSCLKRWLVTDTRFACPVCRVPLKDTLHDDVAITIAAPG